MGKREDRIIRSTKEKIYLSINEYLKCVGDPVEQFSAYLHLIVRSRYLIELAVCWQLQGFSSKHTWEKAVGLSQKCARQDWAETEKQCQAVKRGMWKEALELAGGDEMKAFKIYGEDWDKNKITGKYIK